MEERKVVAAAEIANKQLEYFKLRDSEFATKQRGLVQVVQGLSQAYTARGTPPLQQQPPARGGYDAPSHGWTRPQSPLSPAGPPLGPDAATNDQNNVGCNGDNHHTYDAHGFGIDFVDSTVAELEDSNDYVNIRGDDIL
jgi:hypothetical protein